MNICTSWHAMQLAAMIKYQACLQRTPPTDTPYCRACNTYSTCCCYCVPLSVSRVNMSVCSCVHLHDPMYYMYGTRTVLYCSLPPLPIHYLPSCHKHDPYNYYQQITDQLTKQIDEQKLAQLSRTIYWHHLVAVMNCTYC